MQTDEEYRHLAEQHGELESRISELSRQLYRSTSEESERATLKKRKLQLKDRMEQLLRRRREGADGHSSPQLQPDAQG